MLFLSLLINIRPVLLKFDTIRSNYPIASFRDAGIAFPILIISLLDAWHLSFDTTALKGLIDLSDLLIEFDFIGTWGKQLESAQRFKDLFKCYEQAIKIYPDNELVLCNLGSHLFRLEHLCEAAHYFRQALTINNDYLPAYRNLQNVCNALVERWHFRMLNDTYRNEAYREAILKKVQQGFTSVLDIGTGTGILSLYAVSAGATDIHACDYSPTMCSIACQVLEANKMADKVTVINKLSNDLSISHDLPEKKSLVVTETMDAGLLGEHLLQTILHAWNRLLKPPCPELLKQLESGAKIDDHGVVLPFGAKLWAVPVKSYNIARQNYLLDNCDSSWDFSNILLYSDSSEPYDTENLRNDKCKFLGDPVELFCFNFNDPIELQEFYEGKFDKKKVSFEYEGKSDALAVWFDVSLDEDITFSSTPFSEDVCCWEQAVFKFKEPQTSFAVKVSCGEGKLRFNFSKTTSKKTKGKTISEYAVSSDTILFLNNHSLLNRISVLPENFDKVLNVLDLSPFPMLGLQFVKQKKANLVCVLKSHEEVKAVIQFVGDNSLDSCKVKCFVMNEIDVVLSNEISKFDFIINDLFESSGELKEANVNLIPRLVNQLSPDGVLSPTNITMMFQLTHCPWITRTSKVTNEELVQKYNIAQFINIYQVHQQLDINLQILECEYLSNPVPCLQLVQEDMTLDSCRTEDITVSVAKDGCINALPLWYQYQLSTLQEPLSTGERDSHINQVVYVVDPPCNVLAGDTVVINVTYLAGITRLKLKH